jgi:hypothetical protein
MLLDSYAELLTFKLGWTEYQHIWDLLVNTGLACIPFLIFFMKAIAMAYKSNILSRFSLLAQVELHFLSMGCCLIFAIQPYMMTEFSVIPRSQEQCESGEILEQAASFRLPLLWNLLINLSNAVIYTLSQGVGYDHGARSVMVRLDLATIKNIALALETKSFVQQCFIPSMRKYILQQEGERATDSIEESSLWVGDPYFINQTGYYDYFNSLSHTLEERKVQENGEVESETSYLSCREWWLQPGGLKDQLVEELQQRVPGIASYLQEQDFSSFLKKLVQQTLEPGYQSRLTDERSAHESGVVAWVSHWMGRYGLAQEGLAFYPFMSVIIEALPLVQALFLMAGIVLYPFFTLFASYRFQAALRYMVLWISIQSWSYLWVLAGYIDTLLIESLYPGLSLDVAGRLLIDMVALLMYLVLPVCVCILFNQSIKQNFFPKSI